MNPLKLKSSYSLPYPNQQQNQNNSRQLYQPLSPLSKFNAKNDKDLAARRRHSLAPETVPIPKSPSAHFLTRNRHSFIFSSAGNAGNSQIVAIDSKIEQAMDLVKTHLMFAVREEVEILRNKILQLETTVIQLEAENAILREHVPAEVLQNLNGTSTQPTKPQTTYVTAQ